MITNGRLEGIIEQVRRQLASRSLGGSIDILQGASYPFDFFLASLSVHPIGQSNLSYAGDLICTDLVIEVFRPPFRDQILLELSKTWSAGGRR